MVNRWFVPTWLYVQFKPFTNTPDIMNTTPLTATNSTNTNLNITHSDINNINSSNMDTSSRSLHMDMSLRSFINCERASNSVIFEITKLKINKDKLVMKYEKKMQDIQRLASEAGVINCQIMGIEREISFLESNL